MTLFLHELRQGKISLAIWTAAIALFMVACVIIYPEMETDMAEMGEMFASMGAFTAAFGMDKLNFGTFMGFYSIECGNVIGIGGALFAALTATAALAKEEKDHTAEFLLTHPISRTSVFFSKFVAVMVQVLVLNVVVYVLSIGSIALMDIEYESKELLLTHIAYMIMQFEIAAICFGISAFLHRGSLGIGLGVAIVFYFMNIVKNLTDDAQFLKYITPFAYTDGAEIIENSSLDATLIGIGVVYCIIFTVIGWVKYNKKDIA